MRTRMSHPYYHAHTLSSTLILRQCGALAMGQKVKPRPVQCTGGGRLGVDGRFFFLCVQTTCGGGKRYRNPAHIFALGANRVAGCRTRGKFLHFARFTKGLFPFFFCLFNLSPSLNANWCSSQWLLWQVFFTHSKLPKASVSIYAVATSRLLLCPNFDISTTRLAVGQVRATVDIA